MKRLAIILSGLLALQLAGAVALAFISPDYGAYKANEPLITVDANVVEELAIDASEGESVTLRRQKNTWILPGLHDFPADGTKVASLIERLGKLKRGLPVAVTSSAPKRFKVTEDSYERRIVLRGGGEITVTLADDRRLQAKVIARSRYRQEWRSPELQTPLGARQSESPT